MNHNYIRPGGVAADLPPGWKDDVDAIIEELPKRIQQYDDLLENNPIWVGRTRGVGVISAEEAIAYGITGPTLRSAGVDWDIRKAFPYSGIEQYEFDVPVGEHGDVYDRYRIRVVEIEQSLRIVEQALVQIPPGAVIVDDPLVALPAKREVYNSIEGMIAHFKHIMDGLRVPPGEAYCYTEGGNGELGFFIVADGTGRPYKCYVRSPSFVHLSTAPVLIKDHFIADVVPIFGMINMIGGECDK